MGKKNDQRKARLRAETIRKLEVRTLSPGDLQNVVGGEMRRTTACATQC